MDGRSGGRGTRVGARCANQSQCKNVEHCFHAAGVVSHHADVLAGGSIAHVLEDGVCMSAATVSQSTEPLSALVSNPATLHLSDVHHMTASSVLVAVDANGFAARQASKTSITPFLDLVIHVAEAAGAKPLLFLEDLGKGRAKGCGGGKGGYSGCGL